jgi:hypothetical protein
MGSSRSGTGVTSFEKERIHAGVREDLELNIREEKKRSPRKARPPALPAEKKKKRQKQESTAKHDR